MVLAVLLILATVGLLAWPVSQYLWHEYSGVPIPPLQRLAMAAALLTAAALCVVTFTRAMRGGVRALQDLG